MSRETDRSFDPVEIARALNDAGVRYVVVGGYAVAAWGVIRATRDLDIVFDASWANSARLAKALTALAAEDLLERGDALSQESLVRRVSRRVNTTFGELHLLQSVPGVLSYDDLLPAAIVRVESVDISVASLAALKAMKQGAGRPKDVVDLAELDALNGE